MELLAIWLPKVASCLIILIGLFGFFKPKAMLDSMQFEMGSAMGFTWLVVTAARPYSMLVDGTSLKDSVAPICIDLTVALLFLSHYLLS